MFRRVPYQSAPEDDDAGLSYAAAASSAPARAASSAGAARASTTATSKGGSPASGEERKQSGRSSATGGRRGGGGRGRGKGRGQGRGGTGKGARAPGSRASHAASEDAEGFTLVENTRSRGRRRAGSGTSRSSGGSGGADTLDDIPGHRGAAPGSRGAPGKQNRVQTKKSAKKTKSAVAAAAAKKQRLRKQVWQYLFSRLQASVDELYSVCEFESALLHAKEGARVLDVCAADFRALVDRLVVQREADAVAAAAAIAAPASESPPVPDESYPMSDVVPDFARSGPSSAEAVAAAAAAATAAAERAYGAAPDAAEAARVARKPVAWEVRKSSPMRGLHTSGVLQHLAAQSAATGQSWAAVAAQGIAGRKGVSRRSAPLSRSRAEAGGGPTDGAAPPPERSNLGSGGDTDEAAHTSAMDPTTGAGEASDEVAGDEAVAARPTVRIEEPNSAPPRAPESTAKPPRGEWATIAAAPAPVFATPPPGPESPRLRMQAGDQGGSPGRPSRSPMGSPSSPGMDIDLAALIGPGPGGAWGDEESDEDISELDGRLLHLKLSSPERRKPSPSETRRRSEERAARAELNRRQLEEERQARLRSQANRVRDITERQAARAAEQEEELRRRLSEAEARHEAHVEAIKVRAESENQKVNEVTFITKLTQEEARKGILQKQQAAEARRNERLKGIVDSASERNAEERERLLRLRAKEEEEAEARRTSMEKRLENARAKKEDALRARAGGKPRSPGRSPRDGPSSPPHGLRPSSSPGGSRPTQRSPRTSPRHPSIGESTSDSPGRRVAPTSPIAVGGAGPRSDPLATVDDSAMAPPTLRSPPRSRGSRTPARSPETKTAPSGSDADQDSGRASRERAKAQKKRARKLRSHMAAMAREHPFIEATVRSQAKAQAAAEANRRAKVLSDLVASYKGAGDDEKEAAEVVAKAIAEVHDEAASDAGSSTSGGAGGVGSAGATTVNPRLVQLVSELSRAVGLGGVGGAPGASERRGTKSSDGHDPGEADAVGLSSVMETTLRDLCHIMEGSKGTTAASDELMLMRVTDGISSAVRCCTKEAVAFSPKVVAYALRVVGACIAAPENCTYVLLSNFAAPMVDVLVAGLDQLCASMPSASAADESLVVAALDCLWTLLRHDVSDGPERLMRDAVVRYSVYSSALAKLGQYFSALRAASASTLQSTRVHTVLHKTLAFLETLTSDNSARDRPVFSGARDGNVLTRAMAETDLLGLPSLLLTLLMVETGPSPRHKATEAALPQSTWLTTILCLKILNNVGRLDLATLQAGLGDPAIRLEFHHALSLLLTHVGATINLPQPPTGLDEMLAELLLLIGYYVLQNPANQETMQWGKAPTPLQQLCGLPFRYFSDPRCKDILFPTLVATSHGSDANTTVIRDEVSTEMLLTYIQEQQLADASAPAVPQGAADATADGSHVDASDESDTMPAHFSFRNRFPPELWESAIAAYRTSA